MGKNKTVGCRRPVERCVRGLATGVLLLLLLLPLLFLAACDSSGDIPDLKADEVKKMIDGGVAFVLVDTRSEPEYLRGHLPGSINIPQEKFDVIELFLPRDKDKPLVFFCRGYG
jgi:hypothetical protein